MRQDVRETMTSEIMSVPDVARALNVGMEIAYNLTIKWALVDHVKAGNRVFIDREDFPVIEEFWEKRKANPIKSRGIYSATV